MPEKLSHDEYVNRLYKVNSKVEVIGVYNNMREKITCVCKTCGRVFNAYPQGLLKGAGCKSCSIEKNKRTIDDIKSVNFKKNPDAIKLYDIINIEERRKGKIRVRCKCKIDGHEWVTGVHHLYSGHGCPVCATRNRTFTDIEIIDRVRKKHPTIKVIGSRWDGKDKSKIKCECSICQYQWDATVRYLLSSKSECPKCGGTKKLTNDEFVNRLREIHPNIIALEEYKNMRTPILCKCEIHNYIWKSNPTSMICGAKSGCPLCASSKGEKEIERVLRKHEIDFCTQKYFSDCVDKRYLYFDFYLPAYNTCIEFDGLQHFQPVRWSPDWDDETMHKVFEKGVRHDKIKNAYCEQHNIRMVRIPYSQFEKIEKIIEENILGNLSENTG